MEYLNFNIDPSSITRTANIERVNKTATTSMLNSFFDNTKKVLSAQMLSDEEVAVSKIHKSSSDLNTWYGSRLNDPRIYNDKDAMTALEVEYSTRKDSLDTTIGKSAVSTNTRLKLMDSINDSRNMLGKQRDVAQMNHNIKSQIADTSLTHSEYLSQMREYSQRLTNTDGTMNPSAMSHYQEIQSKFTENLGNMVRLGAMTEGEAKTTMSAEMTDIFVNSHLKNRIGAIARNSKMSLDEKEKAFDGIMNDFNGENFDNMVDIASTKNKYLDKEIMHNHLNTLNPYSLEKIKQAKARQVEIKKNMDKLEKVKPVTIQAIQDKLDKRDFQGAVDGLYGEGAYISKYNNRRWVLATDKNVVGKEGLKANDPNSPITIKLLDNYATSKIHTILKQTPSGERSYNTIHSLVGIALEGADLNMESDPKNAVAFIKDLSAQSNIPYKILDNGYKIDRLKYENDLINGNTENQIYKNHMIKKIQTDTDSLNNSLEDRHRLDLNRSGNFNNNSNSLNGGLASLKRNNNGMDIGDSQSIQFIEENSATPVFISNDLGTLRTGVNMITSEDNVQANVDESSKDNVFNATPVHEFQDRGFSDLDTSQVIGTLEYRGEHGFSELTDYSRGRIYDHFNTYKQTPMFDASYNKNLLYEVNKRTGRKAIDTTDIKDDDIKNAKYDTLKDFVNSYEEPEKYTQGDEKDLQNQVDIRNMEINQAKGVVGL